MKNMQYAYLMAILALLGNQLMMGEWGYIALRLQEEREKRLAACRLGDLKFLQESFGCKELDELPLEDQKQRIKKEVNHDITEGHYRLNGYLNTAVFWERCDVVDYLLKIGADPNRLSGNSKEYIGALKCPLHLAESKKMVDILIKAGARLDVLTDQGRGILHLVQDPSMVTVFITAGAPLNQKTVILEDGRKHEGMTPLHVTVLDMYRSDTFCKDRNEKLKNLLDFGADHTILNGDGYTPANQAVGLCELTALEIFAARGIRFDADKLESSCRERNNGRLSRSDLKDIEVLVAQENSRLMKEHTARLTDLAQ